MYVAQTIMLCIKLPINKMKQLQQSICVSPKNTSSFLKALKAACMYALCMSQYSARSVCRNYCKVTNQNGRNFEVVIDGHQLLGYVSRMVFLYSTCTLSIFQQSLSNVF